MDIPQSTDSGQSDIQQQYANDFFSDPHGVVDDVTGEIVGGPQGQQQPAAGQQQGQQSPDPLQQQPAAGQQVPAPGQQPGQAQKPPAAAQQPPAAAKPAGFADQFYRQGEAGQRSLDADKFLAFSNLNAQAWAKPQQPAAGQQQGPGQAAQPAAGPQQPEQPPWKQEIQQQLEARRSYEQNLRANMTLGLTRAQAYLQRGGDSETALRIAQRDIEQMISTHLNDYDLETRYKEKETLREREAREREEAAYGPESMRVQAHVARDLGGMELFNQLMFGQDMGAPFVEWLFELTNPDADKLNPQEGQKKLVTWWNKFSSKEANLRRAVDVCKAMFFMKTQPELVETLRTRAASAQAQSRQNQMRAPGGNPNTRRQQSGEPDRVERWLNARPGESLDTV